MHISDTFLIVIAVGPNLPSHFASYRFNLTDPTASRAYSGFKATGSNCYASWLAKPSITGYLKHFVWFPKQISRYSYTLLNGERRWEKHCYPSHVTQPHPFLPRPLLAFCKVSRTHFPSRAETDTVKDWFFVQEHKPMKQPGLESSFSIGESKQNLEG